MIGRVYPFKKQAKYPHMKPEDVAVWERFIDQNPEYFLECEYDVAVGEGAPQNPEHADNIQYDGKILTQKKLDVVGYRNEDIVLVEVKPVANMRGLGQILTYEKFFNATYPQTLPVRKMIVCGSVERELDAMFKEHDIIIKVA